MKVLTVRMADGNVIKLEPYDTLPSTTELAREYAKAGYPDRYVIFAQNHSTASITGTMLKPGETEHGIFLSCILRPSFFPSQAGFLGVLSGTALLEALREHTDRRVGIGWISDIFCEGVRIGGTSIEGKLDSFGSYEYLIVNFAIKMDEENFPPRLSDMVRKVFESENSSIPLIIAKTVLGKFFLLYPHLSTPQKFMELYRRGFVLRGTRIRLLDGSRRSFCKVLGVDESTGALTVETRDGMLKHIKSRSSVAIPTRIRLKKTAKD